MFNDFLNKTHESQTELFLLYLQQLKTYKIAYITETSPDDKHAWSGTAHYAYTSLKKQGHSVFALGPKYPKFVNFICKVINQFTLLFLRKRFDYRHSIIYSKAFGRLFSKELRKLNYDIIIICGGTEYCAYIESDKPLFIIVDRTIQGAINYHPVLSNLLNFSERESIYTDKKAMFKSTKTFFSSQWAAEHAKTFYQLPGNKISVLPFGANLDRIPSRETALKPKDTSIWNLFLIGTSWKNKGVDIALNALQHLLKNNIKAHLTIVGCTAPHELKNENIDVINFTSNPQLLIQRTLSPAKITSIKIDEDTKRAEVFLKPDQISLAIGKGGFNIKLAGKLTGYEIDVFRDTDVDVETEDVDLEEFSDEIEAHIIEQLKTIGCDTAKAVLELSNEELVRRTGIDEETIQSVRVVLASEFED
jgi:glycosyltransferase involved in cell wall biosynthesis